MNCPNKENNMKMCNCSYSGCSRMGTCCECIHYHRVKGQLPACYFPNDTERTYNRSVEHFVEVYKTHKHL